MIIDTHTHTPADRSKWRSLLDLWKKNGVCAAITSCLGALQWCEYPDAKEIEIANELAFDFCRQSEGLVSMLSYINPQNDNALDQFDADTEKGAVGIKLWISLKDKNNSLDSCDEILEAAGKKGLAVLIHACNKRNPFKGELVRKDVAYLAKKHPKTTIIEAHGSGYWQKDIELIKPLKNVYSDVSGFYPQRDIVEGLVGALGVDRVLFGSDSPLRTLPSQLAKVEFANISESFKAKVLFENANKVYSLSPKFDLQVDLPNNIKRSLPIDYESDYFCFCGFSPFSGSRFSAEQVANELEKADIEKAFVASFDCIFAKDAVSENAKFEIESQQYKSIKALPAANPTKRLDDNLLEQLARSGNVIISPYLNNADPGNDFYKSLLNECAKLGVRVFINCETADYRFRPDGCEFKQFSNQQAESLLSLLPENDYVFQGLSADHIKMMLSKSAFVKRVKFEVSRLLDFDGALDSVTNSFGFDNLVWGSEYPLRDIRANRWIVQNL